MELELDGHTYRVGKLDARAQFHIVRRLAPVLGELAPALQGGKGGLDALPPIATAVAKLSDADADYCIFGLLKVVSRKQPNGLGWGPVSTENLLMYDDIGMTQMLKLAWEALTFNMSGFFAALPSDLKEAAQKAKGR
ncbi:phage tail assembly chaperone [Klebsiella pneumoniae]|jgi:hypothetical protein